MAEDNKDEPRPGQPDHDSDGQRAPREVPFSERISHIPGRIDEGRDDPPREEAPLPDPVPAPIDKSDDDSGGG